MERYLVSNSMRSRREVSIFTLFRQFKYGHKSINWIQRLSTPHYGVIAGILGVGIGMTGLYMVLLDGKLNTLGKRPVSEAEQPCNYMVAGLQNLGNNCFLNVILQALASCRSFLPFLRSMSISEDQMMEEEAEKMPLLVALTRIIDELTIVRSEKTILNPRHVMIALSSHIGNFNLMSQQDAAESLLHLLSSLELEILQCYVPHGVSLAEVSEFPSKICKVMEDGGKESERWREHVFGPFDGATGSVLTCRNCSSVLSMDFENFRSLSVPAVLTKAGAITDGCTLESCLRQFTTVEQLESFSCNNCWHIAALKYLSQREGNNEAQQNRVRHCLHLESCDCQNLLSKEVALPTGFSRASKQLIVARCPKILCIHLQRASMNEFGEFLKIQGHISFPLFLDLSPYAKAEMTLEQEASLESKGKWNRQQLPLPNYANQQNRQQVTQMPAHTLGAESSNAVLDILSMNKSVVSVKLGDSSSENILEDSSENAISKSEMVFSDCSGGCSKDEAHYDMKVSHTAFLQSSKSYFYSLSSVIEHYGKFGSGHYGVYRRVVTNSDGGNFVGPIRSDNRQWLYVSDSTVSNVNEEAVFSAEASLLFYERLD